MNSLSISANLEPTTNAEIGKWMLSDHVLSKLKQNGITHLFPVQLAVLPILLKTRFSSARISPGDIFCSAPTGSGKTLAYVLPIIETLITRVIPRIRALIILPTRDLAIQVRNTFDHYIKGSNLKCILLTGQSSFSAEAKSLFTDGGETSLEPIVDIVIATPGRLLDHLSNTRGFSLSHLRFLVIDEADRLLNQSYQNWLPTVLSNANSQDMNSNFPKTRRYSEFDSCRDTLASYTPLQKLLFSATLNQNPAQIASLHLHNPTTISVEDDLPINRKRKIDDINDSLQMVLPPTLSEYMLVASADYDKPLTCLGLIFQENISGVIIFTKSVESAHRLAFLFNSFANIISKAFRAQAISSDARKSMRNEWINDFRDGKINAIISSDLLARGIDFGESVSTVINYDVPTTIQTFTHRVGRCARAGRLGKAYTILEEQQVKWFKSQMSNVSRTHENAPAKFRMNKSLLGEFKNHYVTALAQLESSVKNREAIQNNDNPKNTEDDYEMSSSTSDDIYSTKDQIDDDSDSEMDAMDSDHSSVLNNTIEEFSDSNLTKDKNDVKVRSTDFWGDGWI